MIGKFRKKPVVIEAVQFTDEESAQEILDWVSHDQKVAWTTAGGVISQIFIDTLEGEMTASPNDWIIKGVNGEFYPCKPDIFDKTYEEEA